MIEMVDRIIMITMVEDFEIEVVSIEEVFYFVTLIPYSHCLIGRGGDGGNNSGQSRFFSRGNNRGSSHEHSSLRRSSRSPDRAFSNRRDHNVDKYSSTTSGFSAPPSEELSHRSLPTEALRRKDKSNFDTSSSNDSNNNLNRSSVISDETSVSRSGHTN
jgi:hypothetical protein